MKNFGLKTNKLHRIIAATICVVMLLGLVFQVTLFSAPEGEEKQAEQAVTRVADASTINSWQEYYKDETDTSNVGKIWTDKTVSAGELELVESDLDMVPEEDNFMVGLSALSSSKSVVLEAAIPVDVMLVLDISGSMSEDDDAGNKKISMLVEAINTTIQDIMDMNKDNRVGVVLYSGAILGDQDSEENTAFCPLPLDRYKSKDGNYFILEGTNLGSTRIAVSSSVQNDKDEWMNEENKWYPVRGNTYIQNGLMEAFNRLKPLGEVTEKVEGRIPVITLMSDGAPTAASVNYTIKGDSNIGRGDETDIRMAFLTQLTAAWVKESLKECYVKSPLFYTVGVLTKIDEDDKPYASMVLNPSENYDDLNSWWNTFLSDNISVGESVQLETEDKSINVIKADEKLQKSGTGEERYYVDEFFNASSAEDLKVKFAELVERIKIQSAEFPTEIEPPTAGKDDILNYSGYLVFEDKIGKYMNVENMRGVMYGGEIHKGATFARKFAKDVSEEERATDKEMAEFLNSLVERLNISVEEAKKLLLNAQAQKQIFYNPSSQEISNYIAWYAKEDGSYLEPYSGKPSESKEAVFLNKSYFYYGSSSRTVSGEKLMYLGVRIEEKLEENEKEREQTVRFSIPASLLPLVKYQISRNATNVEDSHTKKMEATPLHLFYEVGLKDGISEYDLSGLNSDYEYLEDEYDSKKIASFYPTVWLKNMEAQTTVQFDASIQNEYYYYTEKTPIYEKKDGEYEEYKGEEPKVNDGKEYYYKKRTYGLNSRIQESMLPIDSRSLNVEKASDGSDGWAIVPGTFRYEKLEQKNKDDVHITGTSNYVSKTDIQRNNNTGENIISVFLGNNGNVVIKQGKILISKKVENFFDGHNELTEFDFEINLKPKSGEKIPGSIKGMKNTEEITCEIKNGKIEFKLVDNKKSGEDIAFWLPAGKSISVAETGENAKNYKTTMIVSQRAQESQTIEGNLLENVEIATYSVATVEVGNNYDPPSEIIKLYKIDSLFNPLEGAVFELYQLECNNPNQHTDNIHNQIIKDGEENECWKWIGEATSEEYFGELEFKNRGKSVTFVEGVYRLVEMKAPKGYMRPVGQWNMSVNPGGNKPVAFKEVFGENGERPPAVLPAEKEYYIMNYKPINPPITGGRGIDRFLIMGAVVAIGGLMITVHLVLQRKRGKL